MDLKVAGRGRELAHRGANLWGAIGARHFGDMCHRSLVRSWSPVVRWWWWWGGFFPKDGGADKHGHTLQMALMGPAGTVCSSGKSAIFQPFQPVWDRQDVHTKRNLHMINRGWERWRETHTQKRHEHKSRAHSSLAHLVSSDLLHWSQKWNLNPEWRWIKGPSLATIFHLFIYLFDCLLWNIYFLYVSKGIYAALLRVRKMCSVLGIRWDGRPSPRHQNKPRTGWTVNRGQWMRQGDASASTMKYWYIIKQIVLVFDHYWSTQGSTSHA